MIPTPHSLSLFEQKFEPQMTPELRRMDMINRARREELNAMVYGMSPRSSYGARAGRRDSARGTTFGSKIADGIGGMLIAAGQRIQGAF